MGRYIMRLSAPDGRKFYLEWSTIVDAPVTFGMILDEFRVYYRNEYGRSGLADLDERLVRVEQNGTSAMSGQTPVQMILLNRAGPDEAELTLDEIAAAYCLREPIRGGWTVPEVS